LRRGEQALKVVQQLLAGQHAELKDIQLFSFRAIPSSKRLDIRLDKLTGRPCTQLLFAGFAPFQRLA
jgi:hypothetical protein